MTIVKVWRSVSADYDGRATLGKYYQSYAAAKDAGDAVGEKPEPHECQVVLIDGRAYPIESEVVIYTSKDAVERELALSKLTKKERVLLGLELDVSATIEARAVGKPDRRGTEATHRRLDDKSKDRARCGCVNGCKAWGCPNV